MDLKLKLIKRDKEGYFTLIKETVKEEGISILNIHEPNSTVSNFINYLYY